MEAGSVPKMHKAKTWQSSFYGYVNQARDAEETDDKTLVLVTPLKASEAKDDLESRLVTASATLEPVPGDTELVSGRMYVVALGEGFARGLFQKYDSEDKQLIQVYLVDVGERKVLGRDTLFVCPEEIRAVDASGCIRVVRVPRLSDECKRIVTLVKGRYCKCFVGEVQQSLLEGPYVEGHVLLEYQCGRYTDLADITSEPVEKRRNCKMTFVLDSEVMLEKDSAEVLTNDELGPRPERTTLFSFATKEPKESDLGRTRDEMFTSGGSAPFPTAFARKPRMDGCQSRPRAQRSFTPLYGGGGSTNFFGGSESQKGSFGLPPRRTFGRRGADEKRYRQYDEDFVERSTAGRPSFTSFRANETRLPSNCSQFSGRDHVSTDNATFYQRVFKEYVIERFPKVLRVRFDRFESADTFLAVNPSVFMNVEREMHTGRARYRSLPRVRKSNVEMGMGCLAYTSINDECPSYFRGVIAESTERFGRLRVYLVDVALAQWVRASDVVDISCVSEQNEPFMQFPVATVRCRLEQGGKIGVKDFVAGAAYELQFFSRDSSGVFAVRFPADEERSCPSAVHKSTGGMTQVVEGGGGELSIAQLLDIGNQSLAAALSAKFRFTSAMLGASLSASGMVPAAAATHNFLSPHYVGNEYAVPYGGAWPMMLPAVMVPSVGELANGAARVEPGAAGALSAQFFGGTTQGPTTTETRDFHHYERSPPEERRSVYENRAFQAYESSREREYLHGGDEGDGFGGGVSSLRGFGGRGNGQRERDRDSVLPFARRSAADRDWMATADRRGGGVRDRGTATERFTKPPLRNQRVGRTFTSGSGTTTANDGGMRTKTSEKMFSCNGFPSFAKGDSPSSKGGDAAVGRGKGTSVWDLPHERRDFGRAKEAK